MHYVVCAKYWQNTESYVWDNMCVLYYKLKYTRHIISYVLHITSHLRNIISNKRHNISFTYVQHIISYVYTTYYLVHTTYYVIIKTKYIMYIDFTTYPVPFLLTIISYVRNIIYYLWCSFTINSTNYNKKGLHSGEGQNNRQTAIKKTIVISVGLNKETFYSCLL